jgi:magnesium-transporting ATPase (P-type)
MFTKGSREMISERCDRIQISEHLNPITPEQRQKIWADKLIVF